MSSKSGYALGYSAHEAGRLARQAAFADEILEDGLRRGGLLEGMSVLDVGSGVGDVAFRAARIVGPNGAVTGVDRWGPSLEIARLRATERGLSNVKFVQSALESFDPDGTFDAIVGRFILQYLSTASDLLSRLKQKLKPGGVVIFQELDNSGASQSPPSPLFRQVNDWIARAFQATGSVHDMGALLPGVYLRAGLPRPQMLGVCRVESGPDTPYYEFLTDVLRSVLPLLEESRAASPAEIEIETLAERLRHDAVSHERTLYSPRIVTAWAKVA